MLLYGYSERSARIMGYDNDCQDLYAIQRIAERNIVIQIFISWRTVV